MIDTNHPQSKHISAACWQIEILRNIAQIITISEMRMRRYFQSVAAPCFVALRWVNEQHFNNQKDIADGIEALQSALDDLVEKPSKTSALTSIETYTCPVCDQSLSCAGDCREKSYCTHCFQQLVYPTMQRLRKAFGSD